MIQMNSKKWWVTVQILQDGRPIKHRLNKEEGEDIKMSEEMAKVKYGIGLTVSLGNYQSARVDIGIELPTKDLSGAGGIDDNYERARDFCNDKLVEEMQTLDDLKKVFKKKE